MVPWAVRFLTFQKKSETSDENTRKLTKSHPHPHHYKTKEIKPSSHYLPVIYAHIPERLAEPQIFLQSYWFRSSRDAFTPAVFRGHPKACPNSIPDLAKECKRYAFVCLFVCLFVCPCCMFCRKNFPPNQLALLDEFSFFQDTACSRSQTRPNQQGHCDLHRST